MISCVNFSLKGWEKNVVSFPNKGLPCSRD